MWAQLPPCSSSLLAHCLSIMGGLHAVSLLAAAARLTTSSAIAGHGEITASGDHHPGQTSAHLAAYSASLRIGMDISPSALSPTIYTLQRPYLRPPHHIEEMCAGR